MLRPIMLNAFIIIPEQYINFDGSNLIAVKVYDSNRRGGIVSGEIGLYGGKTALKFDLNLQTTWKFKPGDDLRRKEVDFDDNLWDEVFVPAKWEDQGYRDYDGYAWYRKSFIYQETGVMKKWLYCWEKLMISIRYMSMEHWWDQRVFSLKTGFRDNSGQEYNAFRGYYLPAGLLKKGQKNVIAVRVLDTGGDGGIYEGPVGIITQAKYIEYWKEIKKGN